MVMAMDQLPEDLLADVLRRLPPHVLAAARCVHSSWRAAVDARRLMDPPRLPLAGILSPAARCFSYSNDHNALNLVLAVSMEDFNWLEYEITPPSLHQDGSSLSITVLNLNMDELQNKQV